MDADKLNEAARVEREKCINGLRKDYNIHKDIQHYAIASCCLEKYALGIFNNGANWLMQQPLADRLTDEEKEKIRAEYNFYKDSWNETELTETTMESFVEIFGKELFNGK